MKMSFSPAKSMLGRHPLNRAFFTQVIPLVAVILLTSSLALAQDRSPIIVGNDLGSLEQDLRAAVASANASPGLDRIEFAEGIFEIELSEGQIEITEPLVIAGSEGRLVRIYRQQETPNSRLRLFAVLNLPPCPDSPSTFPCSSEVPTLRLEYLILEGGSAIGGQVELPPCSTRFDAELGEQDTGLGGAICSEVTVALFETIVRGNEARFGGGGIWARSGVSMEFSSVSGNRVFSDFTTGGGIAIDGLGSFLVCENSQITDNAIVNSDGILNSSSQGGGVYTHRFDGTGCQISGNQAGSGGGVYAWGSFSEEQPQTVSIDQSTVSGNVAVSDGGGISSPDGRVNCTNSRIANNNEAPVDSESQGGGVYSRRFEASNCVVSGNIAAQGGGISAAFIIIDDSTVSNNIATWAGGGIYAEARFDVNRRASVGQLQIVNSTISSNRAEFFSGGGIYWDVPEFVETGAGVIAHSTITINESLDGAGGIEVLDRVSLSAPDSSITGLQLLAGRQNMDDGTATARLMADSVVELVLVSSIVSENTSGDLVGDPDVSVSSTGDRVFTVTSVGFGNFIGEDGILLEQLQDNGCAVPVGAATDDQRGCVQTHRPRVGSPVIDAGSDDLELGLEWDQRGSGFRRLISTGIDTGAFETEPLVIQAFGLEGPTSLRQGEPMSIFWVAEPNVPAVRCVGSGLAGTTWDGVEGPAVDFVDVDSTLLSPESYEISLVCRLDSDEVPAVTEVQILAAVEASLFLEPSELALGEVANLDWMAEPGDLATECIASSNPEIEDWAGPVVNTGNLEIDTSGLLPRSYMLSLDCNRGLFAAQASADLVVTDDPLVVELTVAPGTVTVGDGFEISWSALPDDDFTACVGSGLVGTAWDGEQAGFGTLLINSSDLEPATYELQLTCSRPGQSLSASASVEVEDLAVSLTATPASLIRGDQLTIEWSGTEGLVCTGSGLAGTTWPGGGKPNSGTETISTAPLAAGDYTVGLSCERQGVSLTAEANVVILPLELNLALSPGVLIRGTELTISWSGTEGLICEALGLPGTTWMGMNKPPSGTETLDTENLDRGDYRVTLSCQRLGVEIEATETLTVLAKEAELSLSANSVTIGIEGSQFVEFTVANPSPNPGFELELRLDNPQGYEVVAVFRRAASCTIESGEANEVQCDPSSIPQWICEPGTAGYICRLENLPAGARAGVLVQYQGVGTALAIGHVTAANAGQSSADQSIGN